jgi:hypothetical protein
MLQIAAILAVVVIQLQRAERSTKLQIAVETLLRCGTTADAKIGGCAAVCWRVLLPN